MNSHIFLNSLRIAYHLVHRNIYVMRKNITNLMIDGIILMVCEVVLFGQLLPMIGMPQNFIIPVYLGSVIMFIFFHGYSFADRMVYDLRFDRFIDYQQLLPLPINWLIGSMIISFMIETSILTLAQLTIGLLMLGGFSLFTTINWAALFLFYMLILLFFATLFLTLGFRYTFDWFVSNAWVRRCDPLLVISAVTFPWLDAYQVSPLLGYILLCNPITYATEGLRNLILNQPKYIPMSICIATLILTTIVNYLILARSLKKKIDPVL